MKILMVCLGNICRSPLAEGIFRHQLLSSGLDWEVDSAGTSGWHAGERPDPRSMAVARGHGLDISQQRSRAVIAEDFTRFDFIFAMDEANYQHLTALQKQHPGAARVDLFLAFAGMEGGHNVPDPYWDDQGFAHVYRLLEEAGPRVIQRIQAQAGEEVPVLAASDRALG